ncbi:hypothetical protein MHYP_G00162900 [Metynnis hypsauchen]
MVPPGPPNMERATSQTHQALFMETAISPRIYMPSATLSLENTTHNPSPECVFMETLFEEQLANGRTAEPHSPTQARGWPTFQKDPLWSMKEWPELTP